MIRRDIKITEMIKNKLKELEQNGLINIAYALNSYNFGFIILDSNDMIRGISLFIQGLSILKQLCFFSSCFTIKYKLCEEINKYINENNINTYIEPYYSENQRKIDYYLQTYNPSFKHGDFFDFLDQEFEYKIKNEDILLD